MVEREMRHQTVFTFSLLEAPLLAKDAEDSAGLPAASSEPWVITVVTMET